MHQTLIKAGDVAAAFAAIYFICYHLLVTVVSIISPHVFYS